MADEREYRVNLAIEVRDDFGCWLFTCHSQHTVKARRPMEAWRLAAVEARRVCADRHPGDVVEDGARVTDWAELPQRDGGGVYA